MAEPKKGLSTGAKIALSIVLLGALCVPCTGVMVAIGLPAALRASRTARTAEARGQLEVLRLGIDTLGALPPSLGPTPPLETLGPEPQPWPASADPGWAALGFVPPDALHYSYSVTTDPVLQTVHVEALGDQDGDGVRSSFSRTGRFDGARFAWEDPIVLDELE